jgi:exopolysaccharide production protein ExoZ
MASLNNTTRLHTLDYLRGLAAFSIMIYHYSSWSFGRYDAGDTLGRIGIYGVSIFYVLSGLTLYHVYYENMNGTKEDLKQFYIKRIFRIFPLLWLTIFMDSLLRLKMPDLYTLFLNLTGLFGIIKWDAYIGTGVWSIGNELSFYLFFPVFIILAKRNRIAFFLLSTVLLAVYIYFAYFKLPQYVTFEGDAWYYYIHPLNQVFLFLGGFLIGWVFEKRDVNVYVLTGLAIAAMTLFILYPVDGERVNMIKGNTRIAFTTICFVLCFCFYKMKVNLPSWIDTPLSKLGEYSYSLYLLHPLVWYFFGYVKLILPLPPIVKFIICVVISLIASRIVYLRYEKFFMGKGKAWFKKKVLHES